MATLSTPNHPGLLNAYRPSYEEVEQYSRLIMQHEHRPSSAMSDCQHLNDQNLLTEEKLIHRPSRQEKSKESCCT